MENNYEKTSYDEIYKIMIIEDNQNKIVQKIKNTLIDSKILTLSSSKHYKKDKEKYINIETIYGNIRICPPIKLEVKDKSGNTNLI